MGATRIAEVEIELAEGTLVADAREFGRHLAKSEHGLTQPELADYHLVRRVRHNPHAGPPEGVYFDRWVLIYSDPVLASTAPDSCMSCGVADLPAALAGRAGACSDCQPALTGLAL